MEGRTPSIERLLKQHGPNLSSAIARHLVAAAGVTNVNARKLVQRSGPRVVRLKGIRFPRNERFLYLQEQYQSEPFWRSLLQAFNTSGSVFGLAVNSLIARDGMVPASQFGITSGSPIRLRGHLSHEVVLAKLLEIGLFEMIDSADLGPCVTFSSRSLFDGAGPKVLSARTVAEQVLLGALEAWVRRLGFGSYSKVALRNYDDEPQPKFGQFNWDLTAPTYLHPFVRYRNGGPPTPGFFVADVLLRQELTEQQVRYFVNKATIMRRLPKTRPFLGMLVADHFSRGAFQLGRKEGLVFTTPDALFGEGISAALGELIQTLTNAATVAVKNPQSIGDLFSKLAKIEGAASNLRGPLFEMIVGYCLRNKGSIDIGYPIVDPQTGELAEIDVLVKRPDVVRACECKGYATNNVELDEVKRWLETRVPRIRNYLLSQDYFKKSAHQFEFWTTGQFSKSALDYLERRKHQTSKYDLDWKGGRELREYVRALKETYISRILDEQYFSHPLSCATSLTTADEEVSVVGALPV
jgi:hypothetical protein